jgi:hypothetical protein
VDHAVGILAAVELGAAPFHPGIRRAFEEIDAVDARVALEVGQRQHQRLVDEPVQHQPVVIGVDLGDAAVMALEGEPVRRDDAVELVQRREADRGFAARREPGHVAAHHVFLELRRAPVRPCRHAVAERARPRRHVGRQVCGIVRARPIADERGAAERSRRGQQAAAGGERSAVTSIAHAPPPAVAKSQHIPIYECD